MATEKSRNIPIRFREADIGRMDVLASKLGMTRSGLVKVCLNLFLSHYERNGIAALGPDWREMLRDLDGRTHRYADAAEPPTIYKCKPKGKTDDEN